ncbi:MAG: DUF4157 domain-containing protein [Nannocystaceae bacterium]
MHATVDAGRPPPQQEVMALHRDLGNRGVSRLLRSGPSAPSGVEAEASGIARRGTRGPSTRLPFLDTLQSAFGRHDLRHVQAHFGPEAAEANRAMGAMAYTFGDHVAFAGAASLHTAAHEAAHVVQQRAGVQLKRGVGEKGDAYERHADAVADRVVRGESAEALLDRMAGGPSHAAVQREEDPDAMDQLRTDLQEVDTETGGREPSERDRDILGVSATLVRRMQEESVERGLIRVVDMDGLIRGYAESHHTNLEYAREYITMNRSRGFTAPDGLVWVLRGDAELHDLVHETVHLCSAPAGKTKIRRAYGDEVNEVFTEFFAARYCDLLDVPAAVAYPRQLAFGEALAAAVGIPAMYDAYMKDQGLDAILTKLVEIWKRNGQRRNFIASENDATNLRTVTQRFTNFSASLDPNSSWWIKTKIFSGPEPT